MNELRPVPSLPYHFASSDGHVWRMRGGVLKPLRERTLKNGYRAVNTHHGGRPVTRYVHRLVLEAWAGPAPAGAVARHLAGVKTDNRPEGLVWGSRAQNIADARAHGHIRRGQDHPMAKLTAAAAGVIRHMLAVKVPHAVIAKHFGVSKWTVTDIARGKSWRDDAVPALRDGSGSPPVTSDLAA